MRHSSSFVAELGDKTMFATAGLAAELGPGVAWLGATGGMAAAGLCGVLVGARLGPLGLALQHLCGDQRVHAIDATPPRWRG